MPNLPLPLSWPLIGLVAFAVAVLVLLLPGRLGAFPYYRIGALMSPAELVLYRALQAAIGARCEICPKVRIADLIAVEKGGSRKARTIALNRIAAKHVDFVLADPSTMRVQCAVELDDSSHDRRDRRQRDRFVDRAFEKAGVPLVRIRAQGRYDVQALREALAPHAGLSPAAPAQRPAVAVRR